MVVKNEANKDVLYVFKDGTKAIVKLPNGKNICVDLPRDTKSKL
jgi:hypothetical protein